ncbi:MAG: exodeoxyribonuclease VII small subunit [Chlamydiae bacterium]|nr:MAG: exodeoxyribonuclease VII small subunit [Chlamydiota bacterium]
MAKKKQSFEDSLAQLENVVGKMEGGDIPLDECIDLYEKGVKLAGFCAKELDAAEKRIEKLHKKNEGEFETTPFDEDDTSKGGKTDNVGSDVPF